MTLCSQTHTVEMTKRCEREHPAPRCIIAAHESLASGAFFKEAAKSHNPRGMRLGYTSYLQPASGASLASVACAALSKTSNRRAEKSKRLAHFQMTRNLQQKLAYLLKSLKTTDESKRRYDGLRVRNNPQNHKSQNKSTNSSISGVRPPQQSHEESVDSTTPFSK